MDTCYYTGSSIDIISGILWLKETFQDLNLILDYPLTENNKLEEYYKKLGLNYQSKLQFSNIEIVWSYQKIFYPTFFDAIVNKILSEKKNNFVVIPLGIEINNGAHANILFWDIKNKTVERFEPNGAKYPRGYNYNPKLLDLLLLNKFKSIDEKIEYYSPDRYLPNIGFQLLEVLEEKRCKKIGDPNGFCAIWCIWWCFQKLNNNIDSEKLANQLIKKIKLENKSFKDLIRNFSQNVVNFRDKILKKNNIDINDWLTGNYDQKILDKIENDMINYI